MHDPPAPCSSLIDLAYAGCPQLLQPGNQLIEAPGLTVDVDVQAVLAGLPLRNLLEQQPPTAADAAGLVERILGVSYRGVAAKDLAAAVLNDRLRADVAWAKSCEMSALGSSTSYSKAAAQKSATAGAFVLSMTNFQPSGTRPVSRESNDPSNRRG